MIEKQYLGLTDPAQVINTLCEQLKTAEQLLDFQSGSNQTLIGEAATLRDTVTQQAARIKELEANNAAISKNRDDAVELAKRSTDDCVTALVGKPKFKVGDKVNYFEQGGTILNINNFPDEPTIYVVSVGGRLRAAYDIELSHVPPDDPLS